MDEMVTPHDTAPEAPHGHEAHHHAHGEAGHDKAMSPEEIAGSLMVLAQVATNAGDYESAAEAYASVIALEHDALEHTAVALYNLAGFHARGLGVRQDFVEAARMYHQVELMGVDRANTLTRKCMFEHITTDLTGKTSAEVYAKLAYFVSQVYPEADDQKQEVLRGLIAIGRTCLAKRERAAAEQVLGAAAKFGGDDYARLVRTMLDQASGA